MADPTDMSAEAGRLWGAVLGLCGFIGMAFWRVIGPWTASIKALESFASAQQNLATETARLAAKIDKMEIDLARLEERFGQASSKSSPPANNAGLNGS